MGRLNSFWKNETKMDILYQFPLFTLWKDILIKIKTTYCRETKEIFIEQCPNNKRDKVTLEKMIQDNVEKGTRIYTDGWAAYKGLKSLGYEWDSVNHSVEFVK